MNFIEQNEKYVAHCNTVLEKYTKSIFQENSLTSEAAIYALLNGGKRVRGVLTMATSNMLNGSTAAASVFACAVEMIHAFSLVHDDLPCMDNDDMRRGKAATHIAFGEATALLAGDLLAIQAFETLVQANLPAEMQLMAVKVLAQASGAKGMIYGQELDLKYETVRPTSEQLLAVHKNKTGALIRSSIWLGVLAAEEEIENHAAITQYAENVGLVFQIVDDILDSSSTAEILGKPIGSDALQGKTTFVTMYGLDASRKKAEELTDIATKGLTNCYGTQSNFLCSYASMLLDRIQ